MLLLDQIHGALQDGQRRKPQKVDLEQADLFQGRHGIGGQGALAIGRALQGHILGERFIADDHARRVGGGMASHAFQRQRLVDPILDIVLRRVHLLEG